MNATLIAWIVSLLSMLSPPDKVASVQRLPGWEETPEERTARYASIASDLHDVVFDPEESPLRDTTREETVRVLAAVAFHESGFAKDVDVGPCYRGKGHELRCDSGRSVCLMQLHAPGRTTIDGYTRAQLEGDRKTCFRAALHVASRSYSACRKPFTSLNLYATGFCNMGTANTRMKLATAARLPRAPELDILAADR